MYPQKIFKNTENNLSFRNYFFFTKLSISRIIKHFSKFHRPNMDKDRLTTGCNIYNNWVDT